MPIGGKAKDFLISVCVCVCVCNVTINRTFVLEASVISITGKFSSSRMGVFVICENFDPQEQIDRILR
jgi:hypothetical protein